MSDKQSINKTLRILRQSQGLSQQNVGDELGVNIGTILAWEKDGAAIKMPQLKRLAKFYNVPLENIVSGTGVESTKKGKSEVVVSITLDGKPETLQHWFNLLQNLNNAVKNTKDYELP